MLQNKNACPYARIHPGLLNLPVEAYTIPSVLVLLTSKLSTDHIPNRKVAGRLTHGKQNEQHQSGQLVPKVHNRSWPEKHHDVGILVELRCSVEILGRSSAPIAASEESKAASESDIFSIFIL